MSTKRSPLWKYYDVCKIDSKYAVCLLCNVKLSRGGDGKKAGTSSMKNHLKNKHFHEFTETFGGASLPSKSTSISTSISPTSVNIPSTTSLVQSILQTQPNGTERKWLWHIKDPKSQELHYLIGEMIALDNEPLSLVDRVGFTRLMNKAVPRYKLPSAKYMAEEIIPDIYSRLHTKIMESISKAPAVSVTSDRWTSDMNKCFLSFTAHWLSPEFVFEHAVLAIMPLTGTLTGDISNEMYETMTRWNIPLDKIHIFIHNELNIKKEVKTEYAAACCFIQSLQTVVVESWSSQSDLMEMSAAARRIVAHFSQSALAQETLRAIQKQLKLPEHQLVQDTSSRWTTTYYSQERLLQQKSAISLCISNHNTVNLTPFQWNLMEQSISLLKPFEEITKLISSGCSCISEVIPHVAALRRYLQKEETARKAPNLLHTITSLKSKIEDLFWELEDNKKYLIATFLDPRFKTSFFGNEQAEKAREIILIEGLQMCLKKEDSFNNVGGSPPAKRRAGSVAQDTLWDCFDEVAKDNKLSDDSGKTAIAIELDFYLKMVRIDRTNDPYIWWSANAKQYPILIKLAMIYLSSPCSSVYNQRFFSEAGPVNENERNCRFPLNNEKLLFIHHNLPLVGFKY